jgi:H+/Cl- antiporter ClcA
LGFVSAIPCRAMMSHGAIDGRPETVTAPGGPDPVAVLRSRGFAVGLVLAAVVGLVVSLASWAFLELVHWIQTGVFTDLPDAMGHASVPWWWYVLVLGLAGLPVAFATARMPGAGGHVPAHGLQVGGGNDPADMPGVALAALASLGLGLVVGPEAPLIALGAGLAVVTVRLARRDAPPQMLLIMAAAGSFAAISVIFGSPLVAAVLVIEASGLGGATLPLILLPGLISAGVGSLVFIGMSHWSGLSTSAYSLVPIELTPFAQVTWEEIGWTVLLGVAGAAITQVVRRLGLASARVVPRQPFVVVPAAGVIVAGLAIAFERATDHGADQVLFSGQDALPGLISDAASWSPGALALVLLCKGLAWSVSIGCFRGGPTFPAIYLGAVGGLIAADLPGMSATPAVAVGIGVMVVSFLKLPLSAAIIATALTAGAGAAVGPLIIIGVAVAYLTTLSLEARSGPEGPQATSMPSAQRW